MQPTVGYFYMNLLPISIHFIESDFVVMENCRWNNGEVISWFFIGTRIQKPSLQIQTVFCEAYEIKCLLFFPLKQQIFLQVIRRGCSLYDLTWVHILLFVQFGWSFTAMKMWKNECFKMLSIFNIINTHSH